MKINLHKWVLLLPILTLILLSTTTLTHADTVTPSISAFSASPTSISNDYAVVLTWTNQNATGAALYFNCPTGVTVTTAAGSTFPCNSTQTVSQVNGTDTASFTVTNVSGATATLSATVYPLDANGQTYTSNPSTLTITVTTSSQPLTSFSVASTTLMSGGQQTFTWTGVDTKATFLQLGCVPNVQYFVPGQTAVLPCNTRSLTTDLPASGSQSVTVVTSSLFPSTIPAMLVPSSGSGTYDATHALSTSFVVSGMTIVPDPSATSFSTPTLTITSGTPVSFSWSTANASGANIQFSCTDGITVSTLNSSSTVVALPCNTPALGTTLNPTGTTTLTFTNTGHGTAFLPIILLPASTSGSYFATNAKTLQLQVLAAGAVTSSLSPVTTPVSLVTNSSSAVQATSKQIPSYTFTKALKRGSSNADVKALQTLLALNATLYPEQAVSGYFGPATMRALERFQIKYNIAKAGDAGYGSVGPKTRAILNTIQSI